MPFQPQVNQELTIDDATYRIAEHPSAPGIPYGQEGRQAIVYQLVSPSPSQEAGRGGTPSPSQGEGRGEGRAPDRRALKVFKPRYRLPELVSLAERIAPLAGLSGLQVCQRTVLTPQRHATLLRQHPDLTYAVLMPWVEGPTWMEILVEQRALSPEESLALARSLAGVLAEMEQRRLAHCDLSGPNVLLPGLLPSPSIGRGAGGEGAPLSLPGRGVGGEGGVALVDVEQLYSPGLERPELLPGGSPGYAHRTAPQGLWSAAADRFAGAVLLGEMLGWRDVRVREASWGDNYFDPQEMQRESERFQTLVTVLEERWGAGVAGLFERAWRSEVLADCATFGEWLVMLPEAVPAPEVPPVGVTTEEPEPDALRVLMDLGRQFEERGQLESALQTYRRACELAPAGSGLAEELALIVQDLEGKQREATVPEPPPLPVEEVVGTGTPVRPPEEEEVVFPGPQPLSEGGMAAEAETAAPPPKLPLEEAAVEPVAPTPGSALEKELALIAEGAESKPQEEAPPFELQPSAVEAEAEVTIPPAGKGADLDRLFDDGLAAYGRGEWAKAKELLREVVRRQPVYERDGYEAARTLLAEAERRLAPARRKRVSGWAWALLGLVFVIAWIIYSNYQAERRALVEALKATALAQYQATVTAQAQATATARDQATAQAQAAATVQARATTTARDQATMQPQAAATVQARATATAQAQAAVADSCNPSADQVALFVDANYGGQCVVKGIGQYSNPSAIGLPNDSVSSIRVGSNIQATLYEHDDYQGLYETFTSGDVDLRNNITGDNMVSSVKVQRCASALGVITPENARRIRELRVFQSQSWVESVAFSPDGKVLAWAGDGGIWLHDLQQNRLLRHLTGHTAQTHSVVFSPDGTQLYSGGVDEGGGRIKAWDWRTGAELWSVVAAPEGWGALVRVSNDGQWLASNACWENILWRVSSGEPQRYAELSENGSWPALSPDGKWIAFWEEGRVRLVHVGDTSRFLNVPYSPESVQDFGSFVAFSPNASIVASGMPDGKIRLWKVSDGTLLRTLDGHAQRVWSVIFSPDGQLLVSEAEDDELRLWRVSDGALVHILTDPTGGVRDGAVVFSPDGTLLASATPDGHVRLWGITD